MYYTPCKLLPEVGIMVVEWVNIKDLLCFYLNKHLLRHSGHIQYTLISKIKNLAMLSPGAWFFLRAYSNAAHSVTQTSSTS